MSDVARIKNQLSVRDFAIALLLGVATFVAYLVLCVPGIDPGQWQEVAVAAGLRPPRAVFPGLWRLLTGWLFGFFGVDTATHALKWAGAAAGAVSVSLVYLITRQALSFLMRTSGEHRVWEVRIAPFFAFVAAFLTGAAEPVMRISQSFTPEGLRFLLLLLAVYGLFRWFSFGSSWRLYAVVALVGVLSAETPLAFIVPLFFIGWYYRLWAGILDGVFHHPEHLPSPERLPKWRMFFLLLGSLALAVWVNVIWFEHLGGFEANGWSTGDVYFRYAAGYWHVLADASSLAGWALGLGLGLVPVIVSLRLFPWVARDDRPMPFTYGVILVFVGFVALLQTGVFPAGRFWTFAPGAVAYNSAFLLVFFVWMSALAFAAVGAAFAFECQRTYLPEAAPRPGVLLRGLVPFLFVCALAGAAWRVPKSVEGDLQHLVDDAVAETVRECGDAAFLVTDGHLDAALEVEAARVGASVRPLNIMSGDLAYEKTLRTRHFEAGDDRTNALRGVPALLRVWACERTNGMDRVAIQLGFEIWKRDQKPLPTCSGLVARETGLSEAEVKRGVDAANDLAARALELSKRFDEANVSPALVSAISSVAWRLSRFARLRDDAKLADKLDACNTALKHMLSVIENERRRAFMQLTPREGLQLALRRADFIEGRRYAAYVLRGDADDPEANFAMGMSCLREAHYKEAEPYLRRVLVRRPDEPATLNNLSIVCRKLRRYDEAVALAEMALKRLPKSPEVRQTLADAKAKKP